MKAILFTSLTGLALMVVAGSVSSAELLVTGASNKSGGSTSIALDLVSDGTTRGFDFVIPVGQKGLKVDLSQCFTSLPKGFQGECRFDGSEIAGIAFSWDRATLPEGVYSLGTITINGLSAEKSLDSRLGVQFNAVDVEGKSTQSRIHQDLDVQSRPATAKPAAESTK